MPPTSRITRLVNRQTDDLARLQDDQARALLRLAEDARRELRERLAALVLHGAERTPYTAQQTRVLLAQVEAVVATLRQRMDGALTAPVPALQRKATTDLLAVIRANEGEFREAGNRIETTIIARMATTPSLLHRYSLDKYGADLVTRITREIQVGLFTGASIPKLTERITGTDGVFRALNGRAELIARMETNRAYNDAHHDALTQAAEVLDDPGTDDPLLRQGSEYLDARNDPISRVMDGLVTAIDAPWMVPVSAVRAEEASQHRSSGCVWPVVGAYYVCGSYPIHFGERGREIPYRASWDAGAGLRWSGLTPTQRDTLPAALRTKLAA